MPTMRTSKNAVLGGILIVALGSLTAGAEVLETRGTVDAVTVYRGQALVTRLVDVPGPAGIREIVVTDLPNAILPESIFADTADGASIRSIRYRVRPVARDVREEVKQIDEKIRDVADRQEANARARDLAGDKRALLNKLGEFTAPTAGVELTQGVLNAETLKEMTLFLFEQRGRLVERDLELGRELKALNEEMELLTRQRNELTGGSAKTVREAVVFVDVPSAEGGRVRLRYLVDGATWSPSYNARTGNDRAGVTIEYNAAIQQRSGEDWKDVQMTLSTATPALVARAPVLNPMMVGLAAYTEGQGVLQNGFDETFRQLQERKIALDNNRNGNYMPDQVMESSTELAGRQRGGKGEQQMQVRRQSADFDSALNFVAQDMQMLDLVARESFRSKGAVRPVVDECISVTYHLDGRTSLPSRSDQQLIQVASMPMAAEFFKVASPVLTNYVYEEATVANETAMVLLAGPITSYTDGEFVGLGDIPTVSVGERFSVGFGIDTSLRASRELVKKQSRIQGGNRVESFEYRVMVENFGNTPARLRVVDRLPHASGSELKITFAESLPKLSEDRDYREGAYKKGILRWEADVPAQSTGLEAAVIDYTFELEYDKGMSITGMASAE